MLKAAIVGLGGWGRVLVRSVQGKSERIQFVRAVTRTPTTAAVFARSTGIPVDADWAAALADPEVEAVVLATPNSQHVEQIVAAAAAGKHVFVETPLALSASEARQAYAACETAGRILVVGQNRRFLPAFERLVEVVQDGMIGELMHVEGNTSGPNGYRYPQESWRNDALESPWGGMTSRGLHISDLMIALCGPVAEVDARSHRQVLHGDLDDTTCMLLRFASGITGYLVTLTATAELWQFRVLGSQGWIEMRGEHQLVGRLIDENETVLDFPPRDCERAELEAFADAVENGAEYPVRQEEALANIALLDAIGRSVGDGRPCAVSEFMD